MSLPAPINWLGKASWDDPKHWAVTQSFVAFLRAEGELLQLKFRDGATKTFLVVYDELGEESDFKSRLLTWGLTGNGTSVFGSHFAIFQAAVFCEINAWFAANSAACDRAFVDSDNRSSKTKIDWDNQFWDYLGRQSRRLDKSFPEAALDVNGAFGASIWEFMLLGGSLFGVEWPALVEIRQGMRESRLPEIKNPAMEEDFGNHLATFLDQRKLNILGEFAKEANQNLGFEGLGSLFG